MKRPTPGLGSNLRDLRNIAGFTQTELARRVGVAPAFISQIEHGHRSPSLEVAKSLAYVLGVPTAVLLEGSPVEWTLEEAAVALRKVQLVLERAMRKEERSVKPVMGKR